jgi:hypothetical protein
MHGSSCKAFSYKEKFPIQEEKKNRKRKDSGNLQHTIRVRSRLSVSYFCSPFDETPQRQLQIHTELSEISALRLKTMQLRNPISLHDELIKFFWCHASRPLRDTSFLKIELPWRRAAGLLTVTRASPFAILTYRSWSNNPRFTQTKGIVTVWQKHEWTTRIKWELRIFGSTLTKAKTLWKNPINHLEYWKLRDQCSLHSLCLVTATDLKPSNGEHGIDVSAKRKRSGATKVGQEGMGDWTSMKTLEMVGWRDLWIM